MSLFFVTEQKHENVVFSATIFARKTRDTAFPPFISNQNCELTPCQLVYFFTAIALCGSWRWFCKGRNTIYLKECPSKWRTCMPCAKYKMLKPKVSFDLNLTHGFHTGFLPAEFCVFCFLPSSVLIGPFFGQRLPLAGTIWSTNPLRALIGRRKAETPQLWKQQSTTQLVDRGRASQRAATSNELLQIWWTSYRNNSNDYTGY